MTNDDMTHIPDEVLALLIEEEPSRGHREHLSSCTRCRAALEAMIEQHMMLSQLPDRLAPDHWDRIAFAAGTRRKFQFRAARRVISAIAAVMLFAFGWIMRSATEPHVSPSRNVSITPTIPDSPSNPANRLAALETIVLATGAALVKSPDDAILRQLHNDAKRGRDVLMSQIPVVGDNARWY